MPPSPTTLFQLAVITALVSLALLRDQQHGAKLVQLRHDHRELHRRLSLLEKMAGAPPTRHNGGGGGGGTTTASTPQFNAPSFGEGGAGPSTPISGARRTLQQASCLSNDDVSMLALEAAYDVSSRQEGFEMRKANVSDMSALLAAKADTSAMTTALAAKADTSAMTTALAAKADLSAVAAQLSTKANATDEYLACQCAVCTDLPAGGNMCVPWQAPQPCECLGQAPSSQPYPAATSNPPCCRQEWPAAVTTTQTSTAPPQIYSTPEVKIKINGSVTFVFTGFENVQQVADFTSYTPTANGIRSGNPTNGGTFTHTFGTAGVYFFSSQTHTTLRVKVTVMDCTFCRGAPSAHAVPCCMLPALAACPLTPLPSLSKPQPGP
eukprot:COSAG01_NODE_758_length_13805_cov_23.267912_14_plen_380_part_00